MMIKLNADLGQDYPAADNQRYQCVGKFKYIGPVIMNYNLVRKEIKTEMESRSTSYSILQRTFTTNCCLQR